MITQNTNVIFRAAHLETIYVSIRKSGITFSKSEATKIIGSRRYLEQLVIAGKIRMKVAEGSQFNRWKCNAEDVLRYANYKETKTIQSC